MLHVTETTREEITASSTADDAYDEPFVNDECGDTMWDMTMLNQLTEVLTDQHTQTDKASAETESVE